MQAALKRAGLPAHEIDYVNAHGTSTPLGDEIELRAVERLMGNRSEGLTMSSTKSSVGHLLGAAGAVEAVICALALSDGFLPGSPGTQNVDPAMRLDYLLQGKAATVRHALSNSFGFGGSNCSLILGVAP